MIKNNYSAQRTQNLKKLYSNAIDGSLFNTILRHELLSIDSGELILSNLETVWTLFSQFKKGKISSKEYIEKQNKINGNDIIESFKMSQIAYVYSLENLLDRARNCLNTSIEIDARLYNSNSVPIMIAHYFQGIMNHSRLYSEPDKKNKILVTLIDQVLTFLSSKEDFQPTTVLVDSFGVQALSKMDKESLFNKEYKDLTKIMQPCNYSTDILLRLVSSIREQNGSESTILFKKAVKKIECNPQISIFLNKLVVSH